MVSPGLSEGEDPAQVGRGKQGSRWRRKNKQKSSNPPLGSEGRVGVGGVPLTKERALSNEFGMLKGKLISEFLWISLDEVHEKMAKFSRAP